MVPLIMLKTIVQTTRLQGSSSLDFPGDFSPLFLWDFWPHPMNLAYNHHFTCSNEVLALSLQVVRSLLSSFLFLSFFLFPYVYPWVMLYIHIEMLPCCSITIDNNNNQIATYLFFFATKLYYNKPYICIYTNTNHLVFFHSNPLQGIY